MRRVPVWVALALGGLLACWLMFFNHVERYQAGIAWNFTTGELWLQEPGYHITAPWTLVARVDLRPQRVCITSASHAAFNCKLVQFQSSAWREFIAVEGWRYYWLSNRVSLNASYREEYRGFRDILRGYAFSAQQYPFIKVLEEFDRWSDNPYACTGCFFINIWYNTHYAETPTQGRAREFHRVYGGLFRACALCVTNILDASFFVLPTAPALRWGGFGPR